MQNTSGNQFEPKSHTTFLFNGTSWGGLLLCVVLLSSSSIGRAQTPQSPAAASGSKIGSGGSETHPTIPAHGTEVLVDSKLTDDAQLLKMLEPYRARVRTLDFVIGRLKGDLQKLGMGGGTLGNFVTDGLRAEASRLRRAPVPLMVTNSGGLRKNTIAEGKLRVRDIFELSPFENALIQIELTGDQVIKLLAAVVANKDPQSGAHVTYKLSQENKPELVDAKFVDARGRLITIDRKATYTIATIDFLYGLGSGRYSILREGKNMKPLGITVRDALLRHVRSQTAAGRPIMAKSDNRFTELSSAPENETAPQ
jgi:2',3'-cyclic-nucleotide 2'-phosphodiesterase (5'-nucleotidase family)